MKKLIAICVIFAVVAAAAPVANALVTIDFDAYSDYQNLDGINLGGVTLTTSTGTVEVFANRDGASYRSPINSVSSPTGKDPIIGVFDVPVIYVSLWAGDVGGVGDDDDQWQLDAYDAPFGGNLLGSVTSPIWIGDPYVQLSITATGIMRFEATWLGQVGGIAYDDLEFIPIPAPGAILLGSIGVGLVGWLRRRRTL